MRENKVNHLPLITISLVVINVVFFLVCDLFLFRQQYKIAYHMALNPVLVTEEGQYWRLFTSMFYHFNMEHVMYNMLALLALGMILEGFFGKMCFLLVYFMSGIIADVAVIVYNGIITGKAEEVFAAGASGAVYGLFGAFIAMMLCFRKRFCKKEMGRLLLMVVLLLFGNLSQEGIGHEAHFGGFLGGAVMGIGYCLYLKYRMRKREERKNHYGGDV